jgi:hypothetical protein
MPKLLYPSNPSKEKKGGCREGNKIQTNSKD